MAHNLKKHKALILTLKILPAVMAGFYLLGNAGLGIGAQVLLHYTGLVFAPLLFMYLSSHIFSFCPYHRLFIYYVVLVELLNIVDWYFFIPFNNQIIGVIHNVIDSLLLIGISLQLIVKRKLF